MTIAAKHRVTAEDYRALPEDGKQYQLIEGDLYIAPAPNRFHQDISRNIEYSILKYLETHSVGAIYNAPFDVYLDNENVFQPDLVFVARENYRVFTDAGVEGVPDFVVEILSPGTAKLDRNAKQQVYASRGVREFWLVDPETNTVAVYYLQQDPLASGGRPHDHGSVHVEFFPRSRLFGGGVFQTTGNRRKVKSAIWARTSWEV